MGLTAKLLIIPVERPRLRRAKQSRHPSVGCFQAAGLYLGGYSSCLDKPHNTNGQILCHPLRCFNRSIQGLAKSPFGSTFLLERVCVFLPSLVSVQSSPGHRAASQRCPAIIPVQHTSGPVGNRGDLHGSLKSCPQTFMPNRYCKVRVKICCQGFT